MLTIRHILDTMVQEMILKIFKVGKNLTTFCHSTQVYCLYYTGIHRAFKSFRILTLDTVRTGRVVNKEVHECCFKQWVNISTYVQLHGNYLFLEQF